jgi:nucleoside diphosphate kinase
MGKKQANIMNEKTLVFVKPGNEDIAYCIFCCLNSLLAKEGRAFERFGLTHEITNVPEFLIAKHYGHLKNIDEDVFKATIDAYRNGTMFLTFYSGEDIISRIRENIGPTAPEKAEDWTVRGRFRRDSLESALREKRYLNNTIHASANKEDAEKELDLWMPYVKEAPNR